MQYRCYQCGKTAPVDIRAPKCDCGGLWTLDYQPPKFDLKEIDTSVWGMFRYHKFMALRDDSWKSVTLGEGMTPLVQFDEDLTLKMDYYMPTLSYKDRGAAVLISHCKSIGVESVVQDSSGNAGNAVAAYCGRCGMGCDIYVPEGTSPGKIAMIQAHGATAHVVPGSRDHCADVCRAQVDLEGKYYANHVYNPFFYEGTKTYLYEVYEQLGRIPENLFLPVGNGTLFIGVIKALEHLLDSGCIDHMPQLIAVQSERCDPIVKAAAAHAPQPAKITPVPTMAEGIAIGVPMRGEEILDNIYKYNIRTVTVPEDRILEARSALAKQGIYAEHTTAANLAAYWNYCDIYGKTPDSLITMCGAGLKSDH